MSGNHLIDGDNGKDWRSPKYTGYETEPNMISCQHCDDLIIEGLEIRLETKYGTDKVCKSCEAAYYEHLREQTDEQYSEQAG